MTDLVVAHQRAGDAFVDAVAAVRPDQWDAPTPCADWTVRELVNHVVGEDLWTVPLMAGATLDEVGDRFGGDVLGSDPVNAAKAAATHAAAAVGAPGALTRTVHLSFGDVDAAEYVWQLLTDHLIHTWDLARAVGRPDRLDPDLVDACASWFAAREELYRQAGVIGPRPEPTDGADAQSLLLTAFGRSTHWTAAEDALSDEAVLDELAGHLTEVFTRVPGGVYLYLDPTHKVCNERLAHMLGTSVEEWRALENFRDTFVEIADRGAYCDTYERVVHELDWPDTYEFRALRKDGTPFDAEATIVPLTFRGRKLAYHFVRPVQTRDAQGTRETVRRFQDAWNNHDVERVMALMTDDCVFESTWPPPAGERIEGQAAVRAFWDGFFEQSPEAFIDVEELTADGQRATMRWRYRWGPEESQHVRGVDVYRIRDGKVAEKLSYVKG